MPKRILYRNPVKDEAGNIIDYTTSIIIPARNCGLTIEQIALKDVPAGLPFKIVDTSEIPSDRLFREAWELDPAELTDGVGAPYGVM
jgi:hypothetical protein